MPRARIPSAKSPVSDEDAQWFEVRGPDGHLSAQFGEQTGALRTIKFLVREIQGVREDLDDEHRSGRPVLDYIDTKIMSILEKAPFESAHSIAQVLNVDHATVLHPLHEKMGFKSYCL
jgi:hypothetical protein